MASNGQASFILTIFTFKRLELSIKDIDLNLDSITNKSLWLEFYQ